MEQVEQKNQGGTNLESSDKNWRFRLIGGFKLCNSIYECSPHLKILSKDSKNALIKYQTNKLWALQMRGYSIGCVIALHMVLIFSVPIKACNGSNLLMVCSKFKDISKKSKNVQIGVQKTKLWPR